MKIKFYTLGCKVNQYETECMREIFEKRGFKVSAENEDFDIAVINSCTVTSESDRKTRQLLNRIRKTNKNAVIALTGCMAQTLSVDKNPENADIVVGNTDVNLTVSLVEKYIKEKKKITQITPHERYEQFNTPNISDFHDRTRAYMKIEDGCDRYCSYCIIPYARGFVRSKPLDEIKKEAQSLAKKGFLEIVFVGINLSAYGKGENTNLCDAVETVASVEGIKRIRLGSLEPDHISDEMLMRFKNCEKFCPQFHLSLQSGCDETLKRMNRHYDTKFYAELVTRIRKMFEDATITTDIMVGFAGETEEAFFESVSFLKEIRFAKAHVFAYSRRKGTVADKMPNQIEKTEKVHRSRIMIDAANSCEQEILKEQIGKTLEVLFETSENGKTFGYTKNYLRVGVACDFLLEGKTANVKIISMENDYLTGEIYDSI